MSGADWFVLVVLVVVGLPLLWLVVARIFAGILDWIGCWR